MKFKRKTESFKTDKLYFLTDSVASLSADGGDALDISASGGHGVVARELGQ